MKYTLTFILLLTIYLCSYCQSTTCITIADAENHTILEGASIFSTQNKTGDITDNTGKICLRISDKDSIEINHLAYEMQTLSSEDFMKYANDTLFLKEKDNPLPEITVHEMLTPIALGLTTKNKKHALLEGSFGSQRIMRITIPDSINLWQLKSFSYYAARLLGYTINPKKTQVRLVMYNDKNGRPNQPILTENIILKTHKRKWNYFDLKKYRLFFREKIVYIGLEWLDGERSNKRSYGLSVHTFKGEKQHKDCLFKKSPQMFEGWKTSREVADILSDDEEYLNRRSYEVPGYKMEILNIK